MDADRFDALARSLTAARSRRRALAALSGALGLVVGASSVEEAEAKKKKCPPCKKLKKGKCKKKKPDGTPCPTGTCQSGSCVSSSSPPPAPPPPPVCTPSCTDGKVCQAGNVCACPSTTEACGDTCCSGQTGVADGAEMCFTEGGDFQFVCTCPAGDDPEPCHGYQCCLEADTCNPDPAIGCQTATCSSANDICEVEWAFCNGSSSCGCFTTRTGQNICGDVSQGIQCPQTSECTTDAGCGTGRFCADVSCCSPGASMGLCVTACAAATANATTAARSQPRKDLLIGRHLR
jgi:hypothetical protein